MGGIRHVDDILIDAILEADLKNCSCKKKVPYPEISLIAESLSNIKGAKSQISFEYHFS